MGSAYIYRSGDGNTFKIGRSIDLEERVKNLSTGNPEPLTEFAVIKTEHYAKCETYLKHRLRSKKSKRSAATEMYDVDPDELAAVILEARDYAEKVLPMIAEAERLATEDCDDRIIEPSAEDMAKYQELVKTREEYEMIGYQIDRLEAELKLAIGTARGMAGVADWKMVPRHSFDTLTFRAKHPELYEAFARESRSRTFTLL